jgi:ADP-heptose:LPS heptosyltransferase
MKRILAVSLTLFGDTLLSLPALVAIRKEMPAAKIGYLVGPSFHELFENQPFIDDVIFANTPDHKNIDGVVKVWRLYRVIRNFSPDVAFIFAGSPHYMPLILRLAGVKKVFCIPNKGIYRLLCTNSNLGRDSELDITKHGIEDRLKAVRLYGIEAKPTPIRLEVQKKWITEAMNWLRQKGWLGKDIVVFQVLASSPARVWPKERFVSLALKLMGEFPDLRFVITGSSNERSYCETISALVNDERLTVSAGELSICGLAGLFSKAILLVTPDTGAMHLGHAVGISTVCLYSWSDENRTRALDKDFDHIIIKQTPPDFPNSKPEDKANALSFVPLDDVFFACVQVIKKQKCPLEWEFRDQENIKPR